MKPEETAVIEPPFWSDKVHQIPLCRTLVENFPAIQKEVIQFVREKDPMRDFPKYRYYDGVNEVERDQLYDYNWKAMPLSKFMNEFDEMDATVKKDLITFSKYVQENLPFTYSLLKEYEKKDWLANAFVSRLIPGSVIHPHRGRSDLFLRVHLCLIEDPGCQITVGSETQTWKLGQLLSFKDGGPYNHAVTHTGKDERIILSVDLLITEMKKFIKEL